VPEEMKRDQCTRPVHRQYATRRVQPRALFKSLDPRKKRLTFCGDARLLRLVE